MKTNKSHSAVASLAKGKTFVFGVMLLIFLTAGTKTQGVDIFATPIPRDTTSIPYPTMASFLAATKTGDALIKWPDSSPRMDALERSLMHIFKNEFGIKINDISANCQGAASLLFANITDYETVGPDTQKGKWAADAFHDNRNLVAREISEESLAALDAFTKEYSKAVKAYLTQKQEQAEQRKAAVEKEKQQSEAMERQAQAQREQKAKDQAAIQEQQKTAEAARNASIAAAEATKAEAIQKVRKAQQEERAKLLAECLESPAYKLWQASLEVEAGIQIIQKAQKLLDHDNAVTRESNVSNLSERRAAGEDIVTGKRVVAKAFDEYKRLGGAARVPEEVVSGPDPAAQFR